MKRKYKALRYTAITLASVLIGVVITTAVTTSAEADAQLEQIDAFIEANEVHKSIYSEPETVSLSYAEWQEQQTEPDIYSMDVWTLGSYLYGISELDTTRMLKLITIEGYEEDPTLDYYCACACVTRATHDYFGAGDIYTAFGGADPWYGSLIWEEEWYGIDDHAYGALRDALLNFQYIDQVNGMTTPDEYIYYSDDYGIFVWN